MQQSNRLITNVLATYLRMLLTVGIGLATTRLLIGTLGEVDYGLFMVLGGGLSLVTLISTALADSAQRHMAFEIGRGDDEALREVFSSAVVIYLILTVVIAAVGLALRPVFMAVLTIPEPRLVAADTTYLITLANISFSALATPFLAVFIARQALVQDAVFALLTSSMALAAVFAVPYVHGDFLIGYAVLAASSRVFFVFLQIARGLLLFSETRFRPSRVKKQRVRELLDFAGWSFLGTLAWQVRTQGSGVLLNVFFGPAVNAAYSIALQLMSYVSNFCNAIVTASRPVLTGMEGAGRRESALNAAAVISRFAVAAASALVVPLVLNIDAVLGVWLGRVPWFSPGLAVFLLAWFLSSQLMLGPAVAVMAHGKIRLFTAVTLAFAVMPILLSALFFLYWSRVPAYLPLFMVVAQLAALPVQLGIAKQKVGFGFAFWCGRIGLPLAKALLVPLLVVVGIRLLVPSSWPAILLQVFGYGLALAVFGWLFLLEVNEKSKVLRYIRGA